MKVDKKYLSKSVNMWYYRGRIRIEPDWNVNRFIYEDVNGRAELE